MMGILKALPFATAFALAISGSALAADLLPPPPPPPEVAPYDPGDFSGFYLRGDVGVAINREQLRSTFQDATFNPAAAGVGVDQSNIGDSTFLRLGIGYQFNSWFRADLTGEYRTQASLHAIESYSNLQNPAAGAALGQGYCGTIVANGPPITNGGITVANGGQSRCFDSYSAGVQSSVFLANGYVDLGTWYNLTPYIGAGVGTSYNRMTTITDQAGNNTGFGSSRASAKWTPAWALMAGVAYAVTPNLKLEFGYRYLDMGKMSSNPIVCSNLNGCHFEVQTYKLASNDFHIGMRWLLNANAQGNGQALYWGQNGASNGTLVANNYGAPAAFQPVPESAPLVKRY